MSTLPPRQYFTLSLTLEPVDIAHLERAAERGPAASMGLRLLSNIGPPPGASRTAAPTHVPALSPPSATAATAPTKIKLDIYVGVPLGADLDLDANDDDNNDDNGDVNDDANDAERGSAGDAHDRESDDGDVDGDGDGDEEHLQDEDDKDTDGDEYVDGEGEDALLSFLDAESAPAHLLSVGEDVDEAEELETR